MGNATIRNDIPLGSSYDERGNLLSYKHSDGSWWERVYDARSNMLSYRNSDGTWSEYTYDAHNNELTYRNNEGYWCEYTYDAHNNELTLTDSAGRWLTLATYEHTLRFSKGIYWAGCRRFTRDEALAHWGDRLSHKWEEVSTRALCFIEAINNHESNDLPIKD
jgi:YD repeat-containing protein